MRHGLVVVLLAVLVVIAGCGGTSSTGTTVSPTTSAQTTATSTPTPSATATPFPTPRPTPTRSPISVQGFPAIDGQAVNETALVRTHDRNLSNTSSYTLAIAQRINATDVTVDVEREGNESLLRTALNGTGETDYTNGSTEYIRSEHANGSVTYRTQQVPTRQVPNVDPYTGTVVIDDFIMSAEHAPVATTTYDGVEVVELRASKADLNRSAIVPDTTVDAFTSRLLVDRAGRVRSFTYRISGTRGGKPFLFRLRFRLSDVGSTTVDRPAWVSRAENSS